MLIKGDNESYYNLISKFKSKTGTSALLNTLFNLHGDPIVESSTDAINTFENSDSFKDRGIFNSKTCNILFDKFCKGEFDNSFFLAMY